MALDDAELDTLLDRCRRSLDAAHTTATSPHADALADAVASADWSASAAAVAGLSDDLVRSVVMALELWATHGEEDAASLAPLSAAFDEADEDAKFESSGELLRSWTRTVAPLIDVETLIRRGGLDSPLLPIWSAYALIGAGRLDDAAALTDSVSDLHREETADAWGMIARASDDSDDNEDRRARARDRAVRAAIDGSMIQDGGEEALAAGIAMSHLGRGGVPPDDPLVERLLKKLRKLGKTRARKDVRSAGVALAAIEAARASATEPDHARPWRGVAKELSTLPWDDDLEAMCKSAIAEGRNGDTAKLERFDGWHRKIRGYGPREPGPIDAVDVDAIKVDKKLDRLSRTSWSGLMDGATLLAVAAMRQDVDLLRAVLTKLDDRSTGGPLQFAEEHSRDYRPYYRGSYPTTYGPTPLYDRLGPPGPFDGDLDEALGACKTAEDLCKLARRIVDDADALGRVHKELEKKKYRRRVQQSVWAIPGALLCDDFELAAKIVDERPRDGEGHGVGQHLVTWLDDHPGSSAVTPTALRMAIDAVAQMRARTMYQELPQLVRAAMAHLTEADERRELATAVRAHIDGFAKGDRAVFNLAIAAGAGTDDPQLRDEHLQKAMKQLDKSFSYRLGEELIAVLTANPTMLDDTEWVATVVRTIHVTQSYRSQWHDGVKSYERMMLLLWGIDRPDVVTEALRDPPWEELQCMYARLSTITGAADRSPRPLDSIVGAWFSPMGKLATVAVKSVVEALRAAKDVRATKAVKALLDAAS